jgi:hypothetical protein
MAMMTGLWMTVVSLHLSGSRGAAATHTALLQQDYQHRLAYTAALRQIRVARAMPMMEETPGWMGFRSSIDGFNVNQHPSTGPGGAQDHQDPVAYSNGMWPTGTGATLSRYCVLCVLSRR